MNFAGYIPWIMGQVYKPKIPFGADLWRVYDQIYSIKNSTIRHISEMTGDIKQWKSALQTYIVLCIFPYIFCKIYSINNYASLHCFLIHFQCPTAIWWFTLLCYRFINFESSVNLGVLRFLIWYICCFTCWQASASIFFKDSLFHLNPGESLRSEWVT